MHIEYPDFLTTPLVEVADRIVRQLIFLGVKPKYGIIYNKIFFIDVPFDHITFLTMSLHTDGEIRILTCTVPSGWQPYRNVSIHTPKAYMIQEILDAYWDKFSDLSSRFNN